jgi:hypothetical protein
MLIPIRLSGLLAVALVLSAPLNAANLDGSSAEVGNAEAVRLYGEANDFVSNMSEGQYSYSYLQFYWKRAQSNVDRVRTVYANSPTARALDRNELKLGSFPLSYFKERVLYNLEVKRLGAFDDVNCSIFLYGIDEDRNDPVRDEALASILEVMARRQRWGEALRFPVLGVHRPLLLRSVFRIAAFYDQPEIVRQMIKDTHLSERNAAGFNPILAEALALQGKPRAQLYQFVANHPDDSVRTAALKGVVERAVLIQRMETLHISFKDSIQTVHLVVQHTALRDDVPAVAARLFPGSPSSVAPLLAVYRASLGVAPKAQEAIEAHLAYVQYLADAGRMDAVGSYARDTGLTGPDLRACELKAIELYAEAGQTDDAERVRKEYSAAGTVEANEAALAQFRGRMNSADFPLVAREKTFAELPISDPCVMATAIMDWSLTPNRSQRGATPWDAVINRFAGGFENLPKPKSAVVGDAASTLKPY